MESASYGVPNGRRAIVVGSGFVPGVGRCSFPARRCSALVSVLPTQGCGPSALPLGYLGIHRFAVLVSARPREGRRVAAGRVVGGLGWNLRRTGFQTEGRRSVLEVVLCSASVDAV